MALATRSMTARRGSACKALMVAGSGSSLVSCALAVAFRGLGLKVAAMEVLALHVPRTQLLAKCIGREVLPMHPLLLGSARMGQLLSTTAVGCDVVLLDGGDALHAPASTGASTGVSSSQEVALQAMTAPAQRPVTAMVAQQLGVSVLLIVDGSQVHDAADLARHVQQEVAAVPGMQLAAVLINQVPDAAKAAALREELPDALQAAGLLHMVLAGVVPAQPPHVATPDALPGLMCKHLQASAILQACTPVKPGLGSLSVPQSPAAGPHSLLTSLTASAKKAAVAAAGGHTSQNVGGSGAAASALLPVTLHSHARDPAVVIAVAQDAAFQPCFSGDCAALTAAGATLAFFSPLHDAQLPEACQGVLLGGVADLSPWAGSLAANAAMRAALKAFCEAGGVLLAQAAGLAYLSKSVTVEGVHPATLGGLQLPMVGVLPFRAVLPAAHEDSPDPSAPTEVDLTVTPAAGSLLLPSAAAAASGTGGGSQRGKGGTSCGGADGPCLRGILHSHVQLVEELTHVLGPWRSASATGGAGVRPSTHSPALLASPLGSVGAERRSGGRHTSLRASRNAPVTEAGDSSESWPVGYCVGNTLASAAVWPLVGFPDVTQAWVDACGRVDAGAVQAAVTTAAATALTAGVAVPGGGKGTPVKPLASPCVAVAANGAASGHGAGSSPVKLHKGSSNNLLLPDPAVLSPLAAAHGQPGIPPHVAQAGLLGSPRSRPLDVGVARAGTISPTVHHKGGAVGVGLKPADSTGSMESLALPGGEATHVSEKGPPTPPPPSAIPHTLPPAALGRPPDGWAQGWQPPAPPAQHVSQYDMHQLVHRRQDSLEGWAGAPPVGVGGTVFGRASLHEQRSMGGLGTPQHGRQDKATAQRGAHHGVRPASSGPAMCLPVRAAAGSTGNLHALAGNHTTLLTRPHLAAFGGRVSADHVPAGALPHVHSAAGPRHHHSRASSSICEVNDTPAALGSQGTNTGAAYGSGAGLFGATAPPWMFPRGAQRTDGVVSLCPGATDMLLAMGLGGRLVGVTDMCELPPALEQRVPLACRRLPLDTSGLNTELQVDEDLLREEQPAVVVVPDLGMLPVPDQLALSRALHRTALSPAAAAQGHGGRVVHNSPRTLANVLDSILQLGDATGAPQAAGMLVERLRARLRTVAANACATSSPPQHSPSNGGGGEGAQGPAPAAPLRVLVLSALWPSLCAAGMWVPEMVSLAGAAQATAAPDYATSPPPHVHARSTRGPTSAPSSNTLSGMEGTPAASTAAFDAAGGEEEPRSAPVTPQPPAVLPPTVEIEPGEPDQPLEWSHVLSMAPDVLIVAGLLAGQGLAGLAALPGWWSIPAVRSGAVFLVDASLLTLPGPRLVEGVEVVAGIVHHVRQQHALSGCGASPRTAPAPAPIQPAPGTWRTLATHPHGPAAGRARQQAGQGAGPMAGDAGDSTTRPDGTGPTIPLGCTALKLSLCGGQRCRPSLLPNYLQPWAWAPECPPADALPPGAPSDAT